jgi:alpha-mannosidase
VSRAELFLERAQAMRQQLEDLILSLRAGQKLLSFDTYQTNARNKVDPGIDKSAIDKAERTRLNNLLQTLASQIDVAALADGSIDKFTASVDAVRAKLGPIRDFAQQFTLYFDANAHIDAAWLWRDKETVEVVKNTFSSVLKMMNERPDFTYTQSTAAYYDWMERLHPDLFKGIQHRVKDGRWEVVGGMWVEPDCNLPSGESWARHLLYSKRYFQNKLGVDVKIGWNPDSFGYTWNIPMFYADAGIDTFITQKISWNETNVFPHRVFWWESPDGSRVLTYFPFSYVNTIDNPFRLVDWLRQFEANTGFRKLMILFGVGDHGGGPSLQMIDRIEHLKTLDLFPRIEYGTAGTYLDWLKQHNLSGIPKWEDELYLEYHQGTYTSQAKMKEYNRTSEVLLTNAEKFSSLASLAGRKYNSANLEEAWKSVLFNQFHDILPGSGIHENYIDATEKYQQAEELGRFELSQSLKRIAEDANTSLTRSGTPIIVFNALSWTRTDLVTLPLPRVDGGDYAIFDQRGQEVPSQLEQRDRLDRSIVFVAKDVPSVGYTVFELRKQPARREGGELAVSSSVNENDSFRVTVDPDSGWVKSIVDKRVGREILSGLGNELQLLEDTPAQWDAWNIGLTGVKYPSKLRKIDVVERGPVRSTIRITRDYLKPGVKKSFPTEDFPTSFLTQDISLYGGLDRIDFKTKVDWWEEHTMLKVAFPVTISDQKATYEIPFGTIRRSTLSSGSWEKAKVEVPAERWADLSQEDYGVSLLSKTKYAYDIKGNVIRLSLLRSPKWPDPLADRGEHSIEYALYPHRGRVEQADTVQRGYQYNNPLIAIITDRHKGRRPASYSFVQLAPASLILTTIKKAEDSEAWILQWYDARGEDSEAKLTLPRAPTKVVKSSFLETDGGPEVFKGTQVRVPTKKNATTTIKIYFREAH